MLKICLPKTTKRVQQATKASVNASIREKAVQRLKLYKEGSNGLIAERIKELDGEWDVERVLGSHAGILILLTSLLGLKSRRCWFLVTGFIGFFLLYHSLKGWCPSLPFVRKCGIRTAEEINNEKIVLKVLRGDFSENTTNVEEILKNAEN
jgi:DUF2892 family protein